MKETAIKTGNMPDFKNMVESSLGRPINDRDVDVVKVTPENRMFFDRVDKIPVKDFITEMLAFNKNNSISSSDVSVVTADDLNSMENTTSNVKNSSTKLKR